jgi:archaellum component FlaC
VFNLTGGGLFYDAVSNIRLNSINWWAELARMNDELERMNDEMDTINDNLERINDEFNRTNDELRG